jgi:hypothetical protein
MMLLFSILCSNPEQRATITEIENNAWVKQPIDISKYKWEEVLKYTEFHGNNAGDFNIDDGGNLLKPTPRVKNVNQEKMPLTTKKENLASVEETNDNNLKQSKIEDKILINQQNAINLLMSKSF